MLALITAAMHTEDFGSYFLTVLPIYLLAFCTAFVCEHGKGRGWESSKHKSWKVHGLSSPLPSSALQTLSAAAVCHSAPLPSNPALSVDWSSYQVLAIAFWCILLADRPVNRNLFLKWIKSWWNSSAWHMEKQHLPVASASGVALTVCTCALLQASCLPPGLCGLLLNGEQPPICTCARGGLPDFQQCNIAVATSFWIPWTMCLGFWTRVDTDGNFSYLNFTWMLKLAWQDSVREVFA